jgi:hypothetical protein
MKNLNFSNVEELIFRDEEVQRKLPNHFAGLFEQWKLGTRLPVLRQLGKSAMLDFLMQLEEEHIAILEEYFGESIRVETLNYNTVENIVVPLSEEEICDRLGKVLRFRNLSMWRDEESLYLSFWR